VTRARIRTLSLAVLTCLACAGVLYRGWGAGPMPAAAPAATAEPPPLPAAEAACSVTADRAADRARMLEVTAQASIDRYPFDTGEARRALLRLSEAADCARIAGRGADAERVDARRTAWHAHVVREYRDHLTRYRLAVAGRRDDQATTEIDCLLSLLDRDGGAFAARLRRERAALLAVADAPAPEAP
jgi:hypothetical protein